jgi:hypothetical protein
MSDDKPHAMIIKDPHRDDQVDFVLHFSSREAALSAMDTLRSTGMSSGREVVIKPISTLDEVLEFVRKNDTLADINDDSDE